MVLFFFQAEDGIRDLVRSRGLGDVYKRQVTRPSAVPNEKPEALPVGQAGQLPDHIEQEAQKLSLIHI